MTDKDKAIYIEGAIKNPIDWYKRTLEKYEFMDENYVPFLLYIALTNEDVIRDNIDDMPYIIKCYMQARKIDISDKIDLVFIIKEVLRRSKSNNEYFHDWYLPTMFAILNPTVIATLRDVFDIKYNTDVVVCDRDGKNPSST